MNEFLAWLSGKKTVIFGVITTVLAIVQSDAFRELVVIPEIWQNRIGAFAMIFGGLTGVAYRASQAKTQTGQVELAEVVMKAASTPARERKHIIDNTVVLKAEAAKSSPIV